MSNYSVKLYFLRIEDGNKCSIVVGYYLDDFYRYSTVFIEGNIFPLHVDALNVVRFKNVLYIWLSKK